MSRKLEQNGLDNPPKVVYQPQKYEETQMERLKKMVEKEFNVKFNDYWEFHEWSYKNYPEFWDCVWRFFDIVHSKPYSQVYDKKNGFESMEWFKDARLNYAENMLKYRDSEIAIISTDAEDDTVYISYQQLYDEVRVYVKALRNEGIRKGDNIACYMSNKKEAVFAYLATAAIGAVWCGCLPLLGPKMYFANLKDYGIQQNCTRKDVFVQSITSWGPTSKHSLKSLRQILPNGSPAKPSAFDFLSQKVKPGMFCSPAYGTTEVFGLLSGVDHNMPVYRGEIQLPSLGMDVRILDEKGKPTIGQRGECVLANPYPALPISLLNDENKQKVTEMYLAQHPGYWNNGGRCLAESALFNFSDETMDPKGARYNCSDIYFALEGFPGLKDSVVVSQYNKDMDERVILFVKMRPGHTLTGEVKQKINETIERHLTYEHIPDIIMEAPDITGEDRETKRMTYAEIYETAKLYAASFRKFGIKNGDRIAGYISNREEPVFAMLGAVSLGAIWTGALPLIGAEAALNRLKQVQPRILITIDRFRNNGEEIEMLDKVKEIAENEFLQLGFEKDGSISPMVFEQVSFSHPVFINYTSGTTGLPKVLIHGCGGLLTTAKEHYLNRDRDLGKQINLLLMSPMAHHHKRSRVLQFSHHESQISTVWLSSWSQGVLFYHINFTVQQSGNRFGCKEFSYFLNMYATTRWFGGQFDREEIYARHRPSAGWVSWNIFISYIYTGITIIVFEGVPYFLSPTYLWDLVDKYQISTLFFTPSILDELEKRNYVPTSTELMGSCMIFDRTLPIYRGEISCPSLAIDLACVDDSGNSVLGEVGELVIKKPTPSLPLGLWGDSDASRYKQAYFSKYSTQPDWQENGDSGEEDNK
ncbi:Acetoacetyl-CoA synthetase like protein [Argiope bruennichi]|uniref:Acetoacetyl-CoA synthetase like protein n=1 Tax=Argiope bruennichi TaxID=94029 RepID=A0A8T0EC83_ARGBR|nr:Acetoacetyl-CoA synthetase like protein [Argiope bruennichi]